MPASAAEMKVNGIWNAKANAVNNYDGTDDEDDASQYVTQRFRSYWNWIASENLKLVYKNEIDMEWGDVGAGTATRNQGGGIGGDAVNLETKNIYLEFMVPDTPVKATMGLQGITLHKGWFISDDAAGARFDMNFDPVSITAYWIGVDGLDGDDSVSSNDNWQAVVSGAYKAENLDARLSLAYQRNPNDLTSADVPESDDLYLLMGEFGMSFDMVSFNVIGGVNFGEVKSDGAGDRDYEGFMLAGNVDFALDMATISVSGAYVSGDDEGDLDKDFQGLAGQTFSWAEIISDGYTYNSNANLAQIGGQNKPSNMYYVAVGADLKPTDTTTIMLDVYYVGMVEDRTVGGDEEDEIGVEIDARLVQKIYDNLSMTVLGAYLLAEDGYGEDLVNSEGDDAFQFTLGLDFKF